MLFKKKVFISYSWESKEHNEWVYRLSEMLENDGISVEIDKNLKNGEDINKFINSIKENDIILVVLTPTYTKKANNLEGGVGRETQILTYIDKNKIIPILKDGDEWGLENVPSYLLGKKGISMNEKDIFNERYNELLKELKLIISPKFIEKLNDAGQLEKGHPNKEKVVLDDIYVFPELLSRSETDEELFKINSENLIDKMISSKRIIVYGDEQSGKTSLCYKLFKELYKREEIPIYLSGDKIKNYKKSINEALYEIYDLKIKLNDIDLKNFILIFDDFHENTINDRKNLEFLYLFKSVIILSAESTPFNFEKYELNDFSSYNILEYSPKMRDILIKNWLNLDDIQEIDPNKKFCKIDEKHELVNIKLGKAFSDNLMPSYPFFILSILSNAEAIGKPLDNSITSQGNCYYFLIYISLIKSGVKDEDINSYENILSSLAFFLYNEKKSEISEEKLDIFFENYKKDYIISERNDKKLFFNLQKSKIILRTSLGNYKFFYKYLYYYFLGKYFSKNYEYEKNEIKNIISNLHLDRNAYICIFLSYHSVDEKLIGIITDEAKYVFEKYAPITLEKTELSPFADNLYIGDFISLPASNNNIEKNRTRDLELKEKFENNIEDNEEIEQENLEEDIVLKEFRKSIKIIEVIGSIIRNHYGSMRKSQQEKAIEAAISITLRIIGYFFSIIENSDKNEILITWIKKRLENIIEKKKIKNNIDLKKKATAIFWNINYFFIFSIIYKTIRSIGSENLSLIISNLQLQKEARTPVVSIIKHGVNIFYRSNIVPEDINNDFKICNFSEIAKLVMKQIITLYSQFHIIEYKDKQRISDILNIKINNNF